MKRIAILSIALLAAALPTLAQQPAPKPTPTPEPLAPDFSVGEISLGVQQFDMDKKGADARSSKFFEYRDIPQGGVLPFARFQGKKGDFRWDLAVRDVTQKDQRYYGMIKTDAFRLTGDYTGIPHNFGNGGRSLLQAVNPNEWRLSDTVQQVHQTVLVALPPTNQIDYNCQPRFGFNPAPTCFSLSALVAPGLAAAPSNVDLKILRGRTNLGLKLTPGHGNFDLDFAYFNEHRSGYRAANGTSFGFGNVVETPEVVRYVTQDFGVNALFKGDWGSAKAAVHFNDFKDKYNDFSFDNPFRVTDSTDAAAYTAPATGSRNGAAVGRTSLPPDNKAMTEMLGATFKFGPQTRLTGDVTLGQWKQDKDPFIPWTTNTAIPQGATALFATNLGGKIDTTALNGFFHTSLTDALGLNARYRHYKLDNKTPRYSMPGYVRFDAVWEEIPRITVPYGYTQDYFDASATYGVGVVGLEAGYRYTGMKREFRESDKTSENTFKGVVDVHSDWITVRGIGEFGSRDYDVYETARSEDASLISPGPPANQTVLRRPDQAKRDLTRLGAQVELSPGKFGLFASYFHTNFKYDRGPVECEDVDLFPGQAQYCPGNEQDVLGLLDDKYDSFNLDASFTPSDRVNLYAFYTWEDGDILQNGRQSAATVNFSTNDIWWANITTKGNTFGAGADFTFVPEKWFGGLFARYQKIEGNNDIWLGSTAYSTAIYGTNPALAQCAGSGETKPGGSNPCAIAPFDDTKLTYVYGNVRYQFARHWRAGATVGYEEYKIADSQTGNTLNYMPASFFLQANNRDYSAWVGYLNLTYRFD